VQTFIGFLFILYTIDPSFGDESTSISKISSVSDQDTICAEALDKRILELQKQRQCPSYPQDDSLRSLQQLDEHLKGSLVSFENLKIDLQTSKDVDFIKNSVMDRMQNDSQYKKILSDTQRVDTKINFYSSSDPKCEGNYAAGMYWPYPVNEILVCIQERNAPKTIESYINTLAHESLHALQDLGNPANTKPPKDVVSVKIDDHEYVSSISNKYILNESYKKDYSELLKIPANFKATLSKELEDEYQALEDEFGKFEKYFFLHPSKNNISIVPKKPKNITDEKFYESSESRPVEGVCTGKKIPFPGTKVYAFLSANPDYCGKTAQEIAILYSENLQNKNNSFIKKLSSNQQKNYFKVLDFLYVGHGRYLGALIEYCQEIHGNMYSALLDGQRRMLINQIPECKEAYFRVGSHFKNPSVLTPENLDSKAEESSMKTVQNSYSGIFSSLYSLKDFGDIFNQKNCNEYVSWDKYQTVD